MTEEVVLELAAKNDIEEAEEMAGYAGKISWAKVKDLAKTKTVILVYLQGLFGTLPWGILGLYFPDFLVEEMNVDIRVVGTVIIFLGLGVAVGALISGFLVDKLFGKPILPLIIGFATILGAIPMAFFVALPPLSIISIYGFAVPCRFLPRFCWKCHQSISCQCHRSRIPWNRI